MLANRAPVLYIVSIFPAGNFPVFRNKNPDSKGNTMTRILLVTVLTTIVFTGNTNASQICDSTEILDTYDCLFRSSQFPDAKRLPVHKCPTNNKIYLNRRDAAENCDLKKEILAMRGSNYCRKELGGTFVFFCTKTSGSPLSKYKRGNTFRYKDDAGTISLSQNPPPASCQSEDCKNIHDALLFDDVEVSKLLDAAIDKAKAKERLLEEQHLQRKIEEAKRKRNINSGREQNIMSAIHRLRNYPEYSDCLTDKANASIVSAVVLMADKIGLTDPQAMGFYLTEVCD